MTDNENEGPKDPLATPYDDPKFRFQSGISFILSTQFILFTSGIGKRKREQEIQYDSYFSSHV